MTKLKINHNLSFKHSPVPGMPPPTPYPNEPYYPKPGPLKFAMFKPAKSKNNEGLKIVQISPGELGAGHPNRRGAHKW